MEASRVFKLNRVQRKEFIRELQAVVLNRIVPTVQSKADYPPLKEWQEKASYPTQYRLASLETLIKRAENDEIYETLRTQLLINPEDGEMNEAVMNILATAYDAGLEGGE